MIVLAVKLVSLFILLWFGTIALNDLVRGRPCHWINLAVPSAAAVAFTWSMGWLT